MAETDWQDELSEQVRELEAEANGIGSDTALAERAMRLLRVVRGYEVRLRQLALRADWRLAKSL